jgi:hypothetical protein
MHLPFHNIAIISVCSFQKIILMCLSLLLLLFKKIQVMLMDLCFKKWCLINFVFFKVLQVFISTYSSCTHDYQQQCWYCGLEFLFSWLKS